MLLKIILNLAILSTFVYQPKPEVKKPDPKVLSREHTNLKMPKLAKKEEYEKTLKDYILLKDNFDKPAFYEKLVLKNGDMKIKFSEFSDFEKDQFYLMQGIKLEKHLYILSSEWDNEAKWLESGQISNLPEDRNISSEIKKYKEDLLKLRKESYKRVENYFNSFVKKNEKNFSSKELDFLKKEFKKFHKKVEWNKENDSREVPEK